MTTPSIQYKYKYKYWWETLSVKFEVILRLKGFEKKIAKITFMKMRDKIKEWIKFYIEEFNSLLYT